MKKFEKYMDDFENYKRYTFKCKCSCPQHCGHSCLDCDYCSDCECETCINQQEQESK